MPSRYAAVLFVLGILLTGCDSGGGRAPATGEAYVGPVTLNLRSELAPKSQVTATVKHGERLEIIETRRRFTKVRTQQGAEGWTDGHLLLSPEQMDGLRRLAETAHRLSPQGIATIFEPLNMHTSTARQSPSFYQIPENAKLEVLAHRLTPRIQNQAFAGASSSRPATPARKPKSKTQASARGIPPPPRPKPPAPPSNWLALSRPATEASQPEPAPPKIDAKPKAEPAKIASEKAAVHMDDWTLVRTRDGKAGWVLSRMLIMAIPDDVAQYAEGHRITSYFSLGDIHDRGETRHNWLWTTIAKGGQPYEFDSFRVFIWNVRHHRYETAYIERNLKGYYPVEVSTAAAASGKATADVAAFSIVTEDDNGHLCRTRYAFSGSRVHMLDRTPYHQPSDLLDLDLRRAGSAQPFPGNATGERQSWFAREWKSVVDWRHRWFK